jgi:hypothetical protein
MWPLLRRRVDVADEVVAEAVVQQQLQPTMPLLVVELPVWED